MERERDSEREKGRKPSGTTNSERRTVAQPPRAEAPPLASRTLSRSLHAPPPRVKPRRERERGRERERDRASERERSRERKTREREGKKEHRRRRYPRIKIKQLGVQSNGHE